MNIEPEYGIACRSCKKRGQCVIEDGWIICSCGELVKEVTPDAYKASLSCLEAFRRAVFDAEGHSITIYPNSKGGLTVWCNTHLCVVAECTKVEA